MTGSYGKGRYKGTVKRVCDDKKETAEKQMARLRQFQGRR